MKNSKVSTEEEAKQVALFKFSLIAPLVNDCHAFPTKMGFFRDVASKEYTLPDGKKATFSVNTIKFWYRQYCINGFDALIQKPRNDIGVSRKLDDNVVDKITELKQKYPHITRKSHISKIG